MRLNLRGAAVAKNVYEFDDRFIAPRFGYRDAHDYYESNAAKHFLAGIARPTLVLLTPRGGHLGFHGRAASLGMIG